MLPSPGNGFTVGGAPAAEVGTSAAEVGALAAEVGALAAEVGALAAETCVGQGGSSARAAGNMPPSETTITIQNALERGMKSSIIMARHCHAPCEGPRSSHARDRRASRADWGLVGARAAPARGAHRAGIERREFPALLPRVLRRCHLRRDGCASGQGGRASVSEGVAPARVEIGRAHV